MGLTNEQKEHRDQICKNLRTFVPMDEKPYVFISYKSDDYDVVLDKIVRKMVDCYGLRVYFDKNFERANDSWISTMQDAIDTQKCCAILAFVSKSYMRSYACMLELLQAYLRDTVDREYLNIIPIIVDDSKDLKDACSMSSEYAKIDEWGEYRDILASAATCQRVNEVPDLSDYIKKVLARNNRITYEKISLLMFRLINNTIFRRFTPSTEDTFFDNLKATIETINSNVFDPDLVNSSARETAPPAKEPLPKEETEVSAPVQAEEDEAAGELPASPAAESEGEKKKVHTTTGDITYTLYGKQYTENQSDMMLRFFAQVLKFHQDMVEQLPEQRGMNCVSLTDYTNKANVTGDMPSYFRVCQYFRYENGQAICVGTAYGVKDKLKKMALLLDIVGEDPSIFHSEQVELPTVRKTAANQAETTQSVSKGRAKKEAKNFL